MKKSTYVAEFGSSEDKIWSKIINHDDISWRSDIEKTEVLKPHHEFVEYRKDGSSVHFEVLMTIPHQRYECKTQECRYQGRFVATLTKKNSRTVLTLEEEVEKCKGSTEWNKGKKRKGFWLFEGICLKRKQKRYIQDLYKVLGEK